MNAKQLELQEKNKKANELLKEYKANKGTVKGERAFSRLVKLYAKDINYLVNSVINSAPIDKLGWDEGDVYSEMLIRVQKAADYVDFSKVTDESKFRFAYVLNNWAGQLKGAIWSKIEAKKFVDWQGYEHIERLSFTEEFA